MNTIHYYRARCGSLYRVTTTEATRARAPPAACRPAAASTPGCSGDPSRAEYPTTPAEVARLVSIGAFVEVPAP